MLGFLILFLGLLNPAIGHASVETPPPIRFGLTPTVPHEIYQVLERWRRYMERKLERPVEFIRRDSYVESMDMLRLKKLDFAWICDYPFIYMGNLTRLTAVPLYHGRPYYKSLLIVPATDTETRSILQLRGKVFAYTDPYSNTGYMTPRYHLNQLGEDPNRFFSKAFFTFAHSNVIKAVAAGLAEGGAVSSQVWETMSIIKPELTAATRIVSSSVEHGFPPIVAEGSVDQALIARMQQLLIEMSDDEEGRQILRELNIDGFIEGETNYYDEIAHMMRVLGEI